MPSNAWPSPIDSAAPVQPGDSGVPVAAPATERVSPPGVSPTRVSGMWTAVVVGIVVALAMLIFILQNQQQVQINFLFVHGHLPLAVGLLFAAVLGATVVVLCGIARIIQLRHVAKHRVPVSQVS